MKEKISNIIKAGAIGDAFGYNVEFQSWEHIRITYDGPIMFSNCDNYIASDDTQMTLFCLEALKKDYQKNYNNENILKRIYEYYLDWNATQYHDLVSKSDFAKQKELHKRQAPGKTCLTALGSGRCGTMENKINDSKGCGGIMRVAPIAFLNKSLEDIIYLGNMQSAITHGHPEGYLSSGFFAGLLHLGIKGSSFEEAYKEVKNKISQDKESTDFINYLNILEKNLEVEFKNPNEMTEVLGEGWTGETALGLAVYAFKHGKSFEHTLIISTNHRGDSDSTASMAGQLFAAFNNLESEDLEVYNKIDLKNVIDKSLDNLEIINDFKEPEVKINKEKKELGVLKVIKRIFK